MRDLMSMSLIIVVLVSPCLVFGMNLPIGKAVDSENLEGLESLMQDDLNLDDSKLQGNIDFNMMYFTETPSTDDGFYYVCKRGTEFVAFFGASMVKYISGDSIFTLQFPGSDAVIPVGESPTGSKTNYLFGNDPAEWKTGVEDCNILRYSEIYTGIDLVYKIQEGNLKYEFVVSPFVDPDIIQLEYSDADKLEVNTDHVLISQGQSKISDSELKVFHSDSQAILIDCEFVAIDSNSVAFNLGDYDTSRELVIDPLTLAHSTYHGGSGNDVGTHVAIEDGYCYVVGYTSSPESSFPLYSGYDDTFGGGWDVFVTKFSVTTGRIMYSTYLGGSANDQGYGIAVENGFAYVTGLTQSSNYPQVNSYNSTYGEATDCFVTKISQNGQYLIYSTFLGGSDADYGRGIDVEDEYVYVTGYTESENFPIQNPFDDTKGVGWDCFVTKFNTDGQSLNYSTYLGAELNDYGYSVAVEGGYAFVSGSTFSTTFPMNNTYDLTLNGSRDAFVTKLSVSGQYLEYSTYLGGDTLESSYGIDVEDGCAYVTGSTTSFDFPTVNAYDTTYNSGTDVFVTKFASDGQTLEYSTYLGSGSAEVGYDIAVETGKAYLTGYTYSDNFPTVYAFDDELNGGQDAFVAEFASNGSTLLYSTFLGGSNSEDGQFAGGIGVENGTAVVVGDTSSYDFPIIDGYDSTHESTDAFLAIFAVDVDSDFDGLYDWEEEDYGTDPYNIDSDLDGYNDAYEISEGTDPLDPYSYPGVASNSAYNVAYSTYIGGNSNDYLEAIEVEDGFMYISGKTSSLNFPMVNSWNSSKGVGYDIFLVKLSEDGQSIIYSTFIGGNGGETFGGMDVYQGCVYICGSTSSDNFPTYLAYDATYNGDDGFLIKLAQDGSSPVFSTYIGGDYDDDMTDVCVEDEYAYICGYTSGDDWPLVNEYQVADPFSQDAIVTKFDSDGQSLIYSTYLSGTSTDAAWSISVDDGYAYVGGMTSSSDFPLRNEMDSSPSGLDAFLTKLSFYGDDIEYSTYIGGSLLDYIVELEAHNGYAYLTGLTRSSDFPVVNALYPTKLGGTEYSGFVSKVNTSGLGFVYSTYLTGNAMVVPNDMIVDKGFVCVTGHTQASDFPLVGGYTFSCDGTSDDAFITKFAYDGQSLLYSSCYGGSDSDYCRGIDADDGKLYIAGRTDSSDYPTMVAYNDTKGIQDDGFLTIFDIDSDADALPDLTEAILGTMSYAIDSDGDNFLDGYEFVYGTDPLDDTDYPPIAQSLFDEINANLAGNASLIQNLITWSDGNASLIQYVMGQLDDNATLLTQVISWLDGNHTAIETLFVQLDGNATLLMSTVTSLNGNSSLIQNLLTWSAGNETLLLNVIDQVDTMDLTEVIAWLDGNHTAIETLFTYMEGNATLLLSTIESVNANSAELDVLAILISGNTAALNDINATHIEDFDALRDIVDELGISVGDADYDGLDDLDELAYGTDPLCIDSDTDNLNDAFEILLGTDPLVADSDLDSYLDGVEIIAGSDPLDPLSYPGSNEGIDPLVLVLAVGGIGIIVVIVLIVGLKKVRATN